MTPREVDAHTPTQVAILLDYDVDPNAGPVPTQFDRNASPVARARAQRTAANVGRPGYCEHGNLAPQCRECANTVQVDPGPEPDAPKRRLRRVV